VDDLGEAGVHAEGEGGVAEVFFEAFGDMEGVGLEDEAWVGAVPEDGGALGVPGEYTQAIGCEQAVGAQVSADGEHTVGGCQLRRGELEGVGAQTPIGGQAEETQMLMRPVSARTLFLAPPKVWR